MPRKSLPPVHRVVVRRRERFETAQLVSFSPSHVELQGGWPEGDFAPTATLMLEALELEARVFDSGARRVTLRPLDAPVWPPRVLRALRVFQKASEA